MPHPLETATAAAVQENTKLLKDLTSLKQELQATLEREAILKGRIDTLEEQLADTKDKADHYLRWNVEITRQLQNIGMFVDEAMRLAKVEVTKGTNGRGVEALEAVERAITEVRTSPS